MLPPQVLEVSGKARRKRRRSAICMASGARTWASSDWRSAKPRPGVQPETGGERGMLGPGSATARGRESRRCASAPRGAATHVGQSPNPRSGKAFLWWLARSCAQVGHDVQPSVSRGRGHRRLAGRLMLRHAGDGPVKLRDACGREVGAAGADDRSASAQEAQLRCRAGARCGLEPQPAQSRRDTRDQPSRMCVGLPALLLCRGGKCPTKLRRVLPRTRLPPKGKGAQGVVGTG